jgi:hypothetical protein
MSGNPPGDGASVFGRARRGTTWALAPVLLFATCGAAQEQSQTDDPLHTATRVELDVAKVVVAQETAWNKGDLESYAKGYKNSPETIFIGRQVLKGYAQILADYKHDYPTPLSMGTLAFSEVEVHLLDANFAVCLGKYHLDRTKKEGGPVDGSFSMVLEKTGEGWKIVLDHAT